MPFSSGSNATDGYNIHSCKDVQIGENNSISQNANTIINAENVYINGNYNHLNIHATKVVVGGHDNVVHTQNSTDVELQNEENDSCCSDDVEPGSSSVETQSAESFRQVDSSVTQVEVFDRWTGRRVQDGDFVAILRRDDVTRSSVCYAIYVGDGDFITVCQGEDTVKRIQVTDQAEFEVLATNGNISRKYSRREVVERSEQRLHQHYKDCVQFVHDVVDWL